MLPLAVPDLSGNEALYLQECITSTFVSTVGAFVTRFEQMVAEAAGCRQAVATSAGTTGLHVALVAAGVEAGDLVLLPSFTFIASANAIAHAGAMPWLVDVRTDSWAMDAELLRQALETGTQRRDGRLYHRDSGRRVAAVVPVHVLGTPADMDSIVAIAREFGLPVIADGAAALGSTSQGRKVGQLGADLTMFSFNGNKTITAGGGGAVAGDNEELVGLVRHLSTTARAGTDYIHDRVGFNYRMTNLQAAVGCAQMERLDQLVDAKRRIRRTYDQAFAGRTDVVAFPGPVEDSACWFSGVMLTDPQGDTAPLRSRLREAGIDARPFWVPMHHQPPFATAPRTRQDVADAIYRRILCLPCSTTLSTSDQHRAIDAVLKALEG